MAQKALLFLALFASTASMILSVPQNIVPIPVPQEPQDGSQSQAGAAPNGILVADNLPQLQPRIFGSLLNLSAYLANAPNDSAALNFIPLITILSAAG